MNGVLDPRAPRFEEAAVPETVSQQADNVLNIIQFRTARKDVCAAIRKGGHPISRGELSCKLDELHILALKSAVLTLEPESAAGIGEMKSWSCREGPGQMANCDDETLFAFIASKLMAQDTSLAEESAVDDEFAIFLARSNSVRKSLATAMARTAGVPRAAGGAPPPRVPLPHGRPSNADPICPKCHNNHFLRFCTAEFATMYKGGPRNPAWTVAPPRRYRESDRGRPAPNGGRPLLLPP